MSDRVSSHSPVPRASSAPPDEQSSPDQHHMDVPSDEQPMTRTVGEVLRQARERGGLRATVTDRTPLHPLSLPESSAPSEEQDSTDLHETDVPAEGEPVTLTVGDVFREIEKKYQIGTTGMSNSHILF